jgi:DNA-directed RNA polymerase subunit RPC12/RpoP
MEGGRMMGFFDKLKEQAASLGAQIDQALDTTKIKAQMASLRRNRAELVGQLGEALLEQFRRGEFNPGALREQADRVFELERQILELETQTESLQAAQGPGQFSPRPQGASEPPADKGTVSSASQPSGVPCPSCGGQMPAGSVFCPYCGSRV